MMSQPILNTSNNTQDYLNQFKNLDKDHLGYLNVVQVKDYFKSQQLPQDDLIEFTSHFNQGRLTPEQFASVMNLSEMKMHGDIGYHSSKFSSLLRHCEEAMKLVEKDRKMKVPSSDSKDMLLKAFKALENFTKQFIQSLEDKPQDPSLNRSIAPSTFEKMPGTFDFDNAPSDSTTSDEPSMQTTPAAAPVFLKDPSFNDIYESPHAYQNEREPALDSPSPLPQMNDAAAFMSSGLEPISNRNSNGDDAKPNSALENDTLRSNVLDSLRNAAMNDTEVDEDENKEREVLFEEDSHGHAIPATPSIRGMASNINNNAIKDVSVDSLKPSTTTPSSFNKQSSDADSKLESTSATPDLRDVNAEDALAPLAASVATVAAATAATAAAATAFSDNRKSDSHSASPLNTTTTKSYAPETFQGGLGDDSSEPFIKNVKDTELKPEDQPSFGAEQAKLDMLNGTDDKSVDHMDSAIDGAYSSSPKLDKSNQLENESKPFGLEPFQGGLGGNGTEPYIKNEKDTLLKPEDQPSFGAAEQERMSKLSSADGKEAESNDMEQPPESKSFNSKDSSFVPESFQSGLGGDVSEPYIKNKKDTSLILEDQPLFGAEQENLKGLSDADNESEIADDLKHVDKNIESSPSLGSTLSKMGAGAAGIAGAAALGLSEHHDADDKSKDRSIASSPLNDASGHNLTSPRNMYSPSLSPGNSLENATPSDVISIEALNNIADKVDVDVKSNTLQGDSTTIDKGSVISSDALNKIADNLDAAMEENDVPSSASMDVSPHEDVHALVEQDTSLPPNIGNEVGIETTNNDSNRLPLSEKAPIPPTVFGNNSSTTTSAGLNNDYTGGLSTMPDSAYRAAPVTNTTESHNLPLDAANAASVSSSSRSLNSNNATKDASSKDSPEDDADSKEEKPGFFKRLFGGRSKSPEPVSRSIPAGSDKVASKDSDTLSAESKDSFTAGNAPIADKIHAFNVNVPQPDVNVKADSLNNDAPGDMPPNAHGTTASLGSPIFNANVSSAAFNSDVNPSNFDLPDTDGKLDLSSKTPKIEDNIRSPGFNSNINVNASDLSPSFEKLSADVKGFPDNDFGKCDGYVSSPGAGTRVSSLGAQLSGPNVDLPDVDGKLDSPTKSPGASAILPSLKTGMKSPNLDKPRLSDSVDIPDIEGKLPSSSADIEGSNSELSGSELRNCNGKLDKSINTPEISGDVKSPGFNANVNPDASGLSGSLGKLFAGLKDLKSDFSGKFDDSVDSPNTSDKSPSLDTDLKSLSDDLPNTNAQMDGTMKTPEVNGKLATFSSDIKVPSVDMPNVDGLLKTPDVDAETPSTGSNLKSPNFNTDVNIDRPDLVGSLGKFSSSFKDLKKDISGKTNSSMDSPNIHEGPLSLSADLERPNVGLPDIDSKLPPIDADWKTPKLDKPSLDGSSNTTDVDGKLTFMDTDINAPNVDLPNVSDKLDRSISAPGVDGDTKLPGFNTNVNMDTSSLSGSLGMLSAGLKNAISGKLDGSLESPNVDGKAPTSGTNIKGPSVEFPKASGELDSSVETPKIDGKLPSLSSDTKTPSVDMPNADGKLDGPVKLPDFDGKIPSVNGDLKSPDFDANVNVDRSDLSGSPRKPSSSFKELKDSIYGKFSGDSPNIDGALPSFNADVKNPELSDVHKELSHLDTDLSTANSGKPSLGGKMDACLSVLDIDGKPSSMDTDINLPNTSGKLDRSISVSNVKADVKTPEFNSDVDLHATGVSASLDKLSASLKSLKNDIPGKFDGFMDTPDVDGKLPAIDADLKGPDADLYNIGGKLDGSMKTSDMEGNLSSLKSDMKSLDTDLPNVDINFIGSVNTPDADIKPPSLDGNMKTPNVNLDTDVDASRPSLSGSLGKLSSGFKDFSGKFNGSVDAPDIDGKQSTLDVDMKSLNADLPDIHKELPSLNADLPGVNKKLPSLDTDMKVPNSDLPDVNKELPSLDADLQTSKLAKPSLDGKLNGTLNAPDLEGKLPSMNIDTKGPKADLPNLGGKFYGSMDTPDINTKFYSIEDDLKTPDANVDANVDASRPSLSGLGKLSSSFKGLKDSISDKFNGSADISHVDGELPSLNADFPDPNGKPPALDSDMSGVKFGMPSFDGKLTNYMDPPTAGAKLPALDADLKKPDVDLPNVSGKLDRSIDIPEIDSDTKLSGYNANVDMNTSSLSGSLGKLSAGLEGLHNDVYGKLDGLMKSPHVEDKPPTIDANIKGPSADLPDVSDKLDGSIGTADINGKSSSLSSDIKTPNFNMPNVDAKLDNSMNVPDIDAKFPYLDGDMKSPDVSLDADADANRPSLSATLGKLSSSFKDKAPNADGELPSVNVDLDRPNVDLPDIDGKPPSMETDLNTSKLEKPSLDGGLVGSLGTPSIDGKLPLMDTDVKALNVDLPNVDGNMQLPDSNANVNADKSGIFGSLGKLSAGLKELKDDITDVFSGSADTPVVNGELPSVNTNYSSPKFGLPDADLDIDGSVDTPKVSGDLPFKDTELNLPRSKLPGGHIDANASINTPDTSAKLLQLDTNPQKDISSNLASVSTSLDGNKTAPKADVDVPDLHSPNIDASVSGSASTTPIALPRKIEPSGSLGKVDAGLTTPKTDVDVPQVDAHTEIPVAPPRSSRLSLNKLSSGAHLDSSIESPNMDVDALETSSGFKGPTFNVHANDKPALEGDLSTGLHRTASGSGDISADKTNGEGSSTSFFSKPMEKISGAINSFTGDGDDELSQDDDETQSKNKTASGYAHLRTRSRTESPEDLSAMLNDIVKRRFSETPSESDVSSLKSDKKADKKKLASGKSRQMDAVPAGLSAGVSEPHASLDGDRPRSFVSDSRFKELDEQKGDATEYSTSLTSPAMPSTAAVDRSSTTAVAVPAVSLDKMYSLESDVEKQLDAMSVSIGQAPQVPAHEDDQLPSPSKTHRSSISLQSTSFQDRSAADAIKSIYDHMTSKLMKGGPKSGNDADEGRVLKVRDGFENFNGFGVKCVSDNEDEEKHTAPSSTLK